MFWESSSTFHNIWTHVIQAINVYEQLHYMQGHDLGDGDTVVNKAAMVFVAVDVTV